MAGIYSPFPKGSTRPGRGRDLIWKGGNRTDRSDRTDKSDRSDRSDTVEEWSAVSRARFMVKWLYDLYDLLLDL